jgi:septum formation protein
MNPASQPRLILASTSRYRRTLLERLQLPFVCIAPGVDETAAIDEMPEALARRLSGEKALAVSARHSQALVLGSDQVATLDATVMHKPGSRQRAIEQLTRCNGQSAIFYTAVTLARDNVIIDQRCVESTVVFRALSTAAITDYVDRDQPLDCAGSFRWEGLGISLFKALRSDDPTALEGLPLIATCDMLEKSQLNILKTSI